MTPQDPPGAWRHPIAVAQRIADTEGGVTVTWLNHWSAMRADWAALSRTDVIGIDGTLLQLLLARGNMRIGRSSADLTIPRYLELVPDARVALIGGGPGVARAAGEKLTGVVFVADGYDDLAALREDKTQLLDSDPNVIILGLGAGLQDRVSVELREAFPEATIFTAGGWLDQLSRSEQYFPPIVHTLRLGWLWRVLHEPRRLAGRYTIGAVRAVRAASVLRRNLRTHAALLEDIALVGRASALGARRPDVITPPVKVMQLVTQLEPAGAQSMARWTEDALPPDAAVDTWFLYDKSGSDLFPTPQLVAPKRPSSPADILRFLRELYRLRDRPADTVLAHTHFSIAAATLLWAHREDVAVVPVHHWPLEKYPASVRGMVHSARRRGRYAEEVFVSPAIVDMENATVIPNPVPAAGPYTDTQTIPADIIVVARHSQEKSLDTVIRAMKELPSRHLTLVGGGPLTEKLVELTVAEGLEDSVTFAGRLPNSAVRDLMRRSRVFVLPSMWEAMPVSLLEAVAEGCVIVVSDIPTHRFLLDRDAAVGFRPGDPQALAASILRAETTELSAGLEAARTDFSEAMIATLWRDVVRAGAQKV